MVDLQQFPYGHRLHFMSPANQALVAHYLTLLQARHYAPLTLEHAIDALKSLCHRLRPERSHAIAQDLTLITADDIDTWLQVAHEELAPSTIQGTLSKLQAFFAFLHDEGHLARPPIRRHRHDVIVPQSLPKPMAEDDIALFFHVIDSLRDRLMFLLMLRCGMRVSEVSKLTWAAINSEAESIRIKGQVDRVVYYASDVADALRLWQEIKGRRADYVFPSPFKRKTGQPLSRRSIQHLMTMYCQQAQLTSTYSCHCLRHSFATQLLNAGASLEVVKELMGHRDIAMTLRYTLLYDWNKRQQYDQAMAQVQARQSIGRR